MGQEETIWERFREGDRSAFELIIREYYQVLFGYGRRFSNDPDLIKDCIHDLFAHLWRRKAYLSATDSIKPYLLTSLRNRIFKEKQQESLFDLLDNTLYDDFPAEESVQDRLIADEENVIVHKRLHQALKSLTPRQYEAVYLRYFQNLSNEQIAGIMHISKPAVANLLHATLRILKEKWFSLSLMILFFFLNACK